MRAGDVVAPPIARPPAAPTPKGICTVTTVLVRPLSLRRTLVSLALLLTALVPLSATPAHAVPINQDGKKHCSVQNSNGDTVYFEHGSQMTATQPNGSSITFTCNDGKWEEKPRQTSSTPTRFTRAFQSSSATATMTTTTDWTTGTPTRGTTTTYTGPLSVSTAS